MKEIFIAEACICCCGRDLTASPAVLMPFVAKRVFGHEPLEISSDWGMRDLKPGMAYTLCNSLQCQDCGALFLDYRFTDAQMAALYAGYRGESYTRQRNFYEPGYATTVAKDYLHRHPYLMDVEAWLAARLPARPAVLDWGGGDGTNSLFLGSASPLHLVDISGAMAVEGATAINSRQARANRYDLVACCQVLEHVSYPFQLLAAMRVAMSGSTLLYIEVPHEGLVLTSPDDRALAPRKRHWHEHVNFFTEESLRKLVSRAGMRVLDVLQLHAENGARSGAVMGMLCRLDETTDPCNG